MKAYGKDIWRAIRRGKKRFFSLVLITALGVITMTGLRASCSDLRYSADEFFDRQQLFDLSVVSTLGLTDGDLSALSKVEGVETAEGIYNEKVYLDDGASVDMTVLSTKGMNVPYILEGSLPTKADEVAVNEKFAINTGKTVGDTVTIEEDTEEPEDGEAEAEKPNFPVKTYKITGVVIDVRDVNKSEGASAFRSPASADYTFFVIKDAVEADIYTAIYIQAAGARELNTYGAEYEEKIDKVSAYIENSLKASREQARYDEIMAEANEEIADAQAEMDEEFAKADKEFADAWADINSGKSEIERNERELRDGISELADGQSQLDEGKAQLKQQEQDTKAMLASARQDINTAREQVQESRAQLAQQEAQLTGVFGSYWPDASWQAYVDSNEQAYIKVTALNAQISRLENELAELEQGTGEYKAKEKEITEAKANLQAAQQGLEAQVQPQQTAFMNELNGVVAGMVQGIDMQISGLDTTAPDYSQRLTALSTQKAQLQAVPSQLPQLAMSKGQLSAVSKQFDAQLLQLEQSEKQAQEAFAEGYSEIEKSQAEIDKGKAELEKGKTELEKGKAELRDGERELIDAEKEYRAERADGEQKIAEAKAELADIGTAEWYIQDRSSLGGYNNIDTDSASIEALGTVFPIIFLIVAVLISLTTITRKVEEERGLIGTYKALGFTNREIRRKYVLFALAASLIGGIIGDIMGYVILPRVIFSIFDIMYCLPEYLIIFDFVYGTLGILLFAVSVVGATVFACSNELRQMPAVLMRPKAPKAGSRVVLEHIPFIWNHFSFLNKVTARNLFRYKKRLIMTVLGITGCTSLLVCGFAIKDSVNELLPLQYERTYMYDLQSTSDDDNFEGMVSELEGDSRVEKYMYLRMETAKVKNAEGREESLQIMVMPTGVEYGGFMALESTEDKGAVLSDKGIFLTENASRLLGLEKGDTAAVQDMSLNESEIKIDAVIKNYLGNKVYISQRLYEELFTEYQPNSVLINFADSFTDHETYAKALSDKEGVVSALSMAEIKRDFSKSFSLVNVAVYIIISLAAGLAIVVLFTLSTTNISERERELATIKVLGFYDREVHSYVNKETFILTFMGILLGLPVGKYLGSLLTNALKMPAVHFAVTIYPISYVYSVAMAVIFALAVNLITNRILNRIDPVEALKSVE